MYVPISLLDGSVGVSVVVGVVVVDSAVYGNVCICTWTSCSYNVCGMHIIITALTTNQELCFTHCKHKSAGRLVHQYFLCVEVDTDADIPATCWLSTWWDRSSIYIWSAYSWCIPDINVVWYSIESQSGKSSEIVTVVVQCDGSQGDTCGEYKQQLPITPCTPLIIISDLVLLLSKVRIGQFKLCAITVDVMICV